MNRTQFSILIICFLIGLASCKEEPMQEKYGVSIQLSETAGSELLIPNDIRYTNLFGNEFSITRLQYIISGIELQHSNGSIYKIDGYQFRDITDPASQLFIADIEVPSGDYSGITLVFGLDEETNLDGAYSDVNLLNWNWPEMLGGGYHFMKMEGKFVNEQSEEIGFATHMGTAREIVNNESVFYPNYIDITINSAFTIDAISTIELEMDILKWYEGPNLWDLNTWGSGIMPNYDAQVALGQNGADAFSIKRVTND